MSGAPRIYATHHITALDADIQAANDRAWRRVTGTPDNSNLSAATPTRAPAPNRRVKAATGAPPHAKRATPAAPPPGREGERPVWLTDDELQFVAAVLETFHAEPNTNRRDPR